MEYGGGLDVVGVVHMAVARVFWIRHYHYGNGLWRGNLLVYYVLEQLFGSACGITFWCWIMNWNRSLGNGIGL